MYQYIFLLHHLKPQTFAVARSLIPQAPQQILFNAFQCYKREERAMLWLATKQFQDIAKTNKNDDFRNKIDIQATKDGASYFFQVKSNIDFMWQNEPDIQRLKQIKQQRPNSHIYFIIIYPKKIKWVRLESLYATI